MNHLEDRDVGDETDDQRFPNGFFGHPATPGPTHPLAGYHLLDQNALPPAYKSELAAGFDIAVLGGAKIYMGETHKFRTGLIIKPPPGHWTMIVPRSSLQKRGLVLANQVGVVDEDYCGPEDEIFVVLRSVAQHPIIVEPLERVCQGIFIQGCRAQFELLLSTQGRSRGGFGSTGR